MSILPADIQDRDGARGLLRGVRRRFPFIERIFADAGYQGPKMASTIAATGSWKIAIVKRSDRHRFVVLPKRWIVERTFAWISRNRRLARDFERYATTVAAFVRLAMIRLEQCMKVGDGENQAADFISATSSIPFLNLTPPMTLGN